MSVRMPFFICAFSFLFAIRQVLGFPTTIVNRASTNVGNFGSCSVPSIKFGTGFDGRKETAFEPADKNSYSHGSAQNIDVITGFMCDALVNTCGADQTAKTTCAAAKAAADTAPAKTGAQADKFNSAFGINTNFVTVSVVDDTGKVVSGSNNASSAASVSSKGSTSATSSVNSSAIGNFGSCSVPKIEFGVGFDGRKETSFKPVDENSFNHGSAQNIGVVSQFICDTLTNTCGADQTAKSTCAKAEAAANAKPAKTGAQADAFNAAFGINTDFVGVAEVDDNGNIVTGTGSGAQ